LTESDRVREELTTLAFLGRMGLLGLAEQKLENNPGQSMVDRPTIEINV
jgi:hypothetical protein